MFRDYKNHFQKHQYLYLISLLLYLLFAGFSTEKIPVNYGLGWDGVVYWKIAADFPTWVENDSLNQYRAQRILPSVTVHYSLKACDKVYRTFTSDIIKPTPQVVLRSFMFMNGICIFISLFYSLRITELLTFTHRQKIIFLIGLFFSFFCLKQLFYYPVLTDYLAFTIGIGLLYYYLNKNDIGLLILMFLGSFTFPTIIYCVFVLLLFPRTNRNPVKESKYISLIFIGIIISYIAYVSYIKLQTTHHFSFILICIYLGGVWWNNTSFTSWSLPLKQGIFWKKLMVFGCIYALAKCIQVQLSNGDVGELTLLHVIKYSLIHRALQYPWHFLSSHFMFFGIILFIPIFYWKSFLTAQKQLGDGFYILIFLNFFLLLGSESRTHIIILPFLILLSSKILKNDLEHNIIFYSLIIIQLLISKFWYPINTPEIYTAPFYPMEFPLQRWFMNTGAWTSEPMYHLHSIILVSTLSGFYFIKKYGIKA